MVSELSVQRERLLLKDQFSTAQKVNILDTLFNKGMIFFIMGCMRHSIAGRSMAVIFLLCAGVASP